MKRLLTLLLISFSCLTAFANHITGGEMFYTLTGQSGSDYTYHVTLKLYRDCFSTGAPLDPTASIAVFDNSNNSIVRAFPEVAQKTIVHLELGTPNPCVSNPPAVCYDVGYYEFDVTLPATKNGYTIAYQRCCRIVGVNNLIGSSTVGSTYTAQIPGTNSLPTAPANNSAHFIGQDTVVICSGNPFTYNFGAQDADGDQLVYSFCNAYTGGTTTMPAPSPPDNPPYVSAPYASPFDPSSPLGPSVTLNTNNGLISGIAPAVGIYVVTVCVDEYRNGVKIATQRKDLMVKVADCTLTTPVLASQYVNCDGFSITFNNYNSNPRIHSYLWSFGDGTTSTENSPTHTYADTGTYAIKLQVNNGEPCSDHADAEAAVYPGFFPGFTVSGICFGKPTSFKDTSHSKYGVINSWSWDFGDLSTNADTSHLRNPTYTYSQMGNLNVQFIVSSNKGCIDTVTRTITIMDKPPLDVAFKDTLICKGDNVQLQAIGSGIFSWTPSNNITNANTATPTVNPSSTSSYIVQLDDNGCINHDTVQVRVVDFVTLQPMRDTVICAGDTIRLGAVTDGVRFNWSPSSGLNSTDVLNPLVSPVATTTYQLTSFIGSCSAKGNVTITLVPYPGAFANPDTMICFNTKAQLHATIKGQSFSWSPASSLSDPNSLDPIASPIGTTAYVLSVFDNIGCPKPGRDTVVVTVLPKVNAYAGKDTSVVVGQPLQFNATGGIGYLWSPSTGLNKTDVQGPVGIYDGSFENIRYKVMVVNEAGCLDSAFVNVKVFKTNPQIFVPTAFTPNGDGLNDVFRPLGVGISKLEYFRIYNRWGQLVFSTTVNEQGWDGKFGNKEQPSGTFVWLVKGVDYTGKVVFAKGTVTLIR